MRPITLTAIPQRRLMLAAKAAVFTVTGLVVGIAASFAAYFVFQALITGDSFRSSIGDPGVVRALIGGGLYLAVLGLLGLGLGAIIRSSAGAIVAVFSLLFVPQLLVGLLPESWNTTIGADLPMEAGNQIFSQHHEPGALTPWTGFAVFALDAVTALVTRVQDHVRTHPGMPELTRDHIFARLHRLQQRPRALQST